MSIIKILDTAIYLRRFGTYTLIVNVTGDMLNGSYNEIYVDGTLKTTISTTGIYPIKVFAGSSVEVCSTPVANNSVSVTPYFSFIMPSADKSVTVTWKDNTSVTPTKYTLTVAVSGTRLNGSSYTVYVNDESRGTYTTNKIFLVDEEASVKISTTNATYNTSTISDDSFTMNANKTVTITWKDNTPVTPTTYELTVNVTGRDGLSGNAYYVTIGGTEQGPYTTNKNFSVSAGTLVEIRRTNAADYTSSSTASSFTMLSNKTIDIKWEYNAPVTYTLTVNVTGKMLSGSSNKIYVNGTLKKTIASSPTTYKISVAPGTRVSINTTEAGYNSCNVSSSSFTMPNSNKTVTIEWTDNTPTIIGPTTGGTYTVYLYTDLNNPEVPDLDITVYTTQGTHTVKTSKAYGKLTLEAGEGVTRVSAPQFDDPTDSGYYHKHTDTAFGEHMTLTYTKYPYIDD